MPATSSGLGSVALPQHGGTAVLRFSASVPGHYPVMFAASAYPWSGCLNVTGFTGNDEHPGGRLGLPSPSPTPATWADQVSTGTQLGVIVVR